MPSYHHKSSSSTGSGGKYHRYGSGSGGYSKTGQSDSYRYIDHHQIVIPVFQPFIQVQRAASYLHQQLMELQRLLRVTAAEGTLMVESSELVAKLFSEMSFKKEFQIRSFLGKAENLGIIHLTKRQFGAKIISFYSMKLEILSLECLTWVLRSLRRDEMCPNERAVQSRIKEAFAYKIPALLWEKILEAV